MTTNPLHWRRHLGRALSARARASVADTIITDIGYGGNAQRIGVTGPPGAGKSSLIARLATHWADQGKVGVLAIDPTSPISGGAVLGDRIRMEEAGENPNLFIRSLSSGTSHDGLCPNIVGLLDVFDQQDFTRVILETVGVGQVSYEARPLVDSFLVVLVPDSGDTIQAMKAGIMEMADIYIINKDDLPAAARLEKELQAILKMRPTHSQWTPPVIMASAKYGRGTEEIDAAITRHRAATLTQAHKQVLVDARRSYHLRSLVARGVSELMTREQKSLATMSIAESYDYITHILQAMQSAQPHGFNR